MDLDFVKAFGSAYIQQTDGGLKIKHHAYRACVQLMEVHERGDHLSAEATQDLYQSILHLEKKDKREYLLQWYQRIFVADTKGIYAHFGI